MTTTTTCSSNDFLGSPINNIDEDESQAGYRVKRRLDTDYETSLGGLERGYWSSDTTSGSYGLAVYPMYSSVTVSPVVSSPICQLFLNPCNFILYLLLTTLGRQIRTSTNTGSCGGGLWECNGWHWSFRRCIRNTCSIQSLDRNIEIKFPFCPPMIFITIDIIQSNVYTQTTTTFTIFLSRGWRIQWRWQKGTILLHPTVVVVQPPPQLQLMLMPLLRLLLYRN